MPGIPSTVSAATIVVHAIDEADFFETRSEELVRRLRREQALSGGSC